MVRAATSRDVSDRAGTDAHAPEADASDAAPSKPLDEHVDNNDNEREHEREHEQLHAGRSRLQSDAERRNELERQRELSRAERVRASLTNNRFLAKKPEAAEKRPERHGDGDDAGDNGDDTLRQQNDDANNSVNDSVDDNAATAAPPAGLTVVPPKRSSVAASIGMHADIDASGHNAAVVHPHAHVLPSVTLRRSKWTQELDDAESCGLFVNDKRAHLRSIHPSTLVRLEERLRREDAAQQAAAEQLGDNATSSRTLQLVDLIHTRKSRARARKVLDNDDATAADDLALYGAAAAFDDESARSNGAARRSQHRIRRAAADAVAMLEIRVDRVILDDHESFALCDRVSAQLRSLYAAYGQLQQQQPWQIHLDRVGAFVDAVVRADNSATAHASAWEAQTVNDAELALHELAKLQLLHAELLAKWRELQDCGRQSGDALPYSVTPLARSDVIALTGVHAFVEVLADGAARSPVSATAPVAHLTTQLEALEVHDACLQQVLRVDRQQHHGDTAAAADRYTLFPAWRRKFYVAVLVNGKQAFATTAQPASGDDGRSPRGLVRFGETFCVRVPFVPESVAAQVLEVGVVRATALSTTAVPLIVPGQPEDGSGGSSSHDSAASAARVPVASLAPSHEWYQFSSTRPIARARWHSSFLNAAPYANATRHPHGRVRVTTSWVAPPARDASVSSLLQPLQALDAVCFLPPTRPPLGRALLRNDHAQLVGRSVARRRNARLERGFSYERDFLVHMRALEAALDPQDPENASAVRLQRHAAAQSQQLAARDVFRTSALAASDSDLLLPTGGSTTPLTKRNALLQLRDREHAARHGTSVCAAAACRSDALANRGATEPSPWQHDVFELPVPLDERELAADERYLALLRPEVHAFDRRLRADAVAEAEPHSVEQQQQLQRLKIRDFVDRVQQSALAATCRSTGAVSAQPKTLASIVQEQPLPLFPGTLDLSGLSAFFAPRRRLRPQAVKRHAPTALAEWPTACDLYVQVQRASNVPVRIASTANDRSAPAVSGESHVFIEICFQGTKRRTTCTRVSSSSSSSGSAVWMETLVVPFRAPLDDWSPESIERCRDDIRVNLFDQVLVPGELDDERLDAGADVRGTGAQVRSFAQQNYFLGGLIVPFTTLHHTGGALEAALRCDMPVEHVGYVNVQAAGDSDTSALDTPRSSADSDVTPRRQQSQSTTATRSPATADRDDDDVRRRSREATFLSLMLTLDPLLPLPIQQFDDSVAYVGSDDTSDAHRRLVQYANAWSAAARATNAATRRRRFDVFVRRLSGGRAFLTQFVGAQRPPQSNAFAHARATRRRLARFVQLVPFVADWHLVAGAKDVWSTSHEFLALGAGDDEEHAVLLCNYLLWLDRRDAHMRSYVVLGRAVPEGDTVYVLRQDAYRIPQQSVLWNASTGIAYHVEDDRCPLHDVTLVVSTDNVFANIQPAARAQDLSWDVEGNPRAWKPFFSAATVQKDAFALPSVQQRDLAYESTADAYVQRVEAEVSETLKREIRRWRSSRATTTFNIDAAMRLRAHLEVLEQRLQGDGDVSNKGAEPHDAQTAAGASSSARVLHELQQTRDVSGMPLNTTFTDVDKVIDLVKNTNIHWTERAGVEFALAVYVCAFPNAVLSVWVYFVSLAPKA